MPGDFGSPYRAPCGGWPAKPKIYLGGCANHVRASEKAIQQWRNETKVLDYHLDGSAVPVNPAGITPYPRGNRAGVCSGGPGFGIPGDCQPGDDCFAEVAFNGNPKCCLWPLAERGALNHAADATHVVVDNNVYEKITAETVDFSKCLKIGWKGVQSRKVWHGQYGFLSNDHAGTVNDVVCPVAEGDACGCSYPAYHGSPDTSKFLTMSLTGHYEVIVPEEAVSEGDDFGTTTADIERSYTVAKNTGVKTKNACSDESDGPTNFFARPAAVLAKLKTYIAYALGTKSDLINLFCIIDTQGEVTSDATVEGTRTAQIAVDLGGFPFVQYEAELTATSARITEYYAEGTGPYTQRVLHERTLVFTNTTLTFHEEKLEGTFGTAGVVTHDLDLAVELTDEYSAATLALDTATLLGYWNLRDDKIYPWRTDGYLLISPLVQLNEVATPVAPLVESCLMADPDDPMGPEIPWYDLNGVDVGERKAYDGSVRGAPLPAGYGPHFDWDHIQWGRCDPEDPATYYVKKVGQFSESPVPVTATKWTENFTTQTVGPGRWRRMTADGILWEQKYAEVILKRPSYNFFGPWGKQRYALDETKAACVESATGDGTEGDPYVVTVVFSGETPDYDAYDGQPVYYNGKIWTLASHTDSEYTLTAPALADVPADLRPAGDTFGPLRFPLAWPIGGRVKVVSATQNGGNVDLVIEPPNRVGDATYLRTGDHVDFSGVSGLATNLAISLTDENEFSVPGTLSGAYTGGGFIQSTGAPDYKWFDTQSKGDYFTIEWEYDFRDYQEADRVCHQHQFGCVCANEPAWPPGFACVRYGLEVIGCGTLAARSNQAGVYYARPGGNYVSAAGYYIVPDGEGGSLYSPENVLLYHGTNSDGSGLWDTDGGELPGPSVTSGYRSDVRRWQDLAGMSRAVKAINYNARCLPFSPCHPVVVCLSPNGETWPNGTTLDFATSFAPDGKYGSLQQLYVQQSMQDRLWQPPHRSCAGFDATDGDYGAFCWREDVGECLPDGTDCARYSPLVDAGKPTYYYPFRPLVEARLTVPASAPALPAGATIGYLPLSAFQTGDPLPAGDRPYPPDVTEGVGNRADLEFQTTWGIWLALQTCVCADGRYKADYQAQGVACST